MHKVCPMLLGLAMAAGPFHAAQAADLEVTHWWTAGAEAAAIRVIAEAFEKTGHNWIDGAIAGAGGVARPLISSRITGGDPMGATQFTHSNAMNELIEAGYIRDVTALADAGGWREVIFPPLLLDSCTFEGKLYCVPSNIHSQQWLWLNTSVFLDNGLAVPTNWPEFVAAAPKLRELGIVPLAQGRQAWQQQVTFNVLMVGLGGPETYLRVYRDHDAEFAAGPEVAEVFAAAVHARDMMVGSNVQEWNLAARMVTDGAAAGQIMGDWVQGEFEQAGKVIGTDIACLPGLGVHEYITATGDAFFFPVSSDAGTVEAQDALANVLLSPEVQVEFNRAKGALPVRSDVDISGVSPCMKRGLEILSSGNVIESVNTLVSPDTLGRVTDLVVEFFSDTSFTPEEAQEEFAKIIATAD
ncbi:MAG: ABC transporter substrate-binding protein [Pseudotabrizicola sp.]|uniref:ABC transporter substrate-binding protein n=1 Tax=Pseudotabrizicola sp. TaxID=2939647 RepID=UPI00271FC752|nr:ABC transporter substrate-binding protein [Pseudotabrizicola sp.]MDO9640751.1 ABC transporter substrate-binding protein [Pseudotabrizicola sp.]